MNEMVKRLNDLLAKVDPRLLQPVERALKKIPYVRDAIDREADELLSGLDGALKPYRGELPAFAALPAKGLPRREILSLMEKMRAREEARWKEGFVSGAVYNGDEEHVRFLDQVYAINSQTNPLHSDVWPSATKLEAEIVSMTARMLGADAEAAGGQGEGAIVGSVTSGGTESILMAMKAYRDRARSERRIRRPEIVAPVTAHAAFDKAAQYFGMKLVKIPVGKDFRADVRAARRALTRSTAVLVGSAPCFPYGTVDPIGELSELARKRRIGFHTDACLGGFVLPWARKLGYPAPAFDFSLPGVTSMSCDTHKYGYAAKGTSVVLYRGESLRHHQFFTIADWPGGLYFSPTMAGSRPGALIASAWASLVATGEQGYLDATRRIVETTQRIREGIRAIPELRVLGESLFIAAFGSDSLDVYRILDSMAERHWNLNGLHRPPALHIAVTLRHTQDGVAERLLSDLREAVAHVRTQPPSKGGMAPAYGMAASLPLRGLVSNLLERYMDRLYRV